MATGIRLHNVDIPPHAIRGQNARLTCKYDMEGDKLYSIKWYRNGHEFYRYIPSDNPSTTIFNGNGINVDKSQSSEEEILLRSVDLDTTGLYTKWRFHNLKNILEKFVKLCLHSSYEIFILTKFFSL